MDVFSLVRGDAEKLVNLLTQRRHTLGVAESCTGGLLAASITRVPGVSPVFKGGVVSYANETKQNLLQVSPQTLLKEGAVSEAVVREMVRGLRNLLQVDWAVSISGVAGPSGGTEKKPVGTVWMAFLGPSVEDVKLSQFKGDREQIQDQSVQQALKYLIQYVNNV
jgi:PncC family amidohydrolase